MTNPIIKKFVIQRDRLPANFPHYGVIYFILFNDLLGWNWWFISGSTLILIGLLLSYAYRKSIEIPYKNNN